LAIVSRGTDAHYILFVTTRPWTLSFSLSLLLLPLLLLLQR
jgi:hypothetical protein